MQPYDETVQVAIENSIFIIYSVYHDMYESVPVLCPATI